jgi:hypothetical protein
MVGRSILQKTLSVIQDGITSLQVTVGAFHNTDEQALPSTGGALLTAGVAQILDVLALANRQRQTGADNITALGVASGTQQLASPISGITGNTSTAIGDGKLATPKTVTLSAITGTNRGVPWSIGVGSVLTIQPGTGSQEFAVVVAMSGGNNVNLVIGSATAGAAFVHTANWTLTSFALNQARDASTPDGATGAGFAAGATYLLNTSLNSGAGGWEGERSAAGELDGASGTGTAIAAEYEFNGGGPLTNAGVPSGLAYDRARSLQAKGRGTSTLNGAVIAGASSITLNAAVALTAGEQIRLDRGTGTDEAAVVAATYVIGALVVPLQSPLQFAHANASAAEWDLFVAGGPALSGFLPTGVGIEEEALFNPVDGLLYIERSASQDSMPSANVVAEAPALWNGVSMDRQRSNQDVTFFASASYGATQVGPDAQNINQRGAKVVLDVTVIGTATVQIVIEGKDVASGKYYTLLSGSAQGGIGTTVYTIYPGLTAAANVVANDILPRTWRVRAVVGGAGAATFSVGASGIV